MGSRRLKRERRQEKWRKARGAVSLLSLSAFSSFAAFLFKKSVLSTLVCAPRGLRVSLLLLQEGEFLLESERRSQARKEGRKEPKVRKEPHFPVSLFSLSHPPQNFRQNPPPRSRDSEFHGARIANVRTECLLIKVSAQSQFRYALNLTRRQSKLKGILLGLRSLM